jgi:hypothetical protein
MLGLMSEVTELDLKSSSAEFLAAGQITLIESPGRGWVADSARYRAVAQGATREEALQKLAELLQTYPEVMREAQNEEETQPREEELNPPLSIIGG